MAGGTGNLILKRGTVVPDNTQNGASSATLVKGMPAVQLVGLSRTSNLAGNAVGPYAYDTYANRLWVGMDAFGTLSSSETGAGGVGSIGSLSFSPPTGSETRAIWMGAEIRATAAVYSPGEAAPNDSPTVLQADWNHPSDLVLVTQKSIYDWATSTFGSSGSVTASSSNTASIVYPLFVTTVGSSTTLLADDSTTALSYVPSTGTLTIAGDLAVNGPTSADITTITTTATVFNTNATTLSMGGAATQINLGGSAPTVIIASTKSGSPTLTFNCDTNGTVTISSDATTGRGDIFTNITTGTINLATGGASITNIGGAGGSVVVGTTAGNSSLTIRGNASSGTATLATNSGVTTANVFNTNATTLNLGGAATTVSLGAATGTTTINNANTVVTGDLAVNGSDITTSGTGTATVFNSNALTLNLGGAATTVSIGSSSGNTTINNNAIVTGDLAVNGSTSADITTTTATASLFNTTATTVNIGGGATTAVNVGSSSGIVAVPGDLKIGGGATTKTVQLLEASGNGSDYVGIKSPDSVATSYTLTLPNAPSGTSGYALVASGTSGALTWASTGNASTVSGTEVSDNAEYNLVLGPLALSGGTLGLSIDSSDGITYNPSTDKLTMTGDLAVNGGDITTTQTIASLLPTTADNIKIGTSTTTGTSNTGGATTFHLGDDGAQVYLGKAGGDSTLTIRGTAGSGGVATISTNTTGIANVFNTAASTVNIGNASTTLNLGGGSTSVVIAGSLTVDGTTTTLNATNLNVVDKNIQMGSVTNGFLVAASGTVGSITGTGPWNATITGMADTSGLVVGSTFTASTSSGSIGSGGTAVVTSFPSSTSVNYTYTSGTTPIGGSVANITSGSPTNTSADGGGLTLKGASDKTFNWVNSTSAWTSSENMDLASGKAYYINGTSVLNATTLGSGVTGSSLTSVGTLTGGTWNANVIGMTYGGTGKNLTPVVGGLVYTDADSMEVLAAGTSGYVLKSNGSSAPTWVDPTTLSSGAASSITVRTETTTTNNTKYPIPFLGSSSANSPASSWSGLSADGNSVTAYLFTDATNTTLASTPSSPTNSSTGLFYEVSDGSSAIGTLYCDYIGATLDCGTYS